MSEQDLRTVLDARLARGEIAPDEYDRILERIGVAAAPKPETNSKEPPPTVGNPHMAAVPVPSDHPRFYVARLWRGYISLPSTYWLWGSLGGSLVGFAAGFVIAASETVAEAVAAIVVAALYSIAITVAIWRSARRYKVKKPDRRGWGTAAQVLSLIGLLAGLGHLTTLIPGNETDQALDDAVAQGNQSGPYMVSAHVRFDNVTRQARVFVYHYTIIGPSHVPSPSDVQKEQQTAARAVCSSALGKRLLLSVDKTSYTYYSEQGTLLMTYDVARADCP